MEHARDRHLVQLDLDLDATSLHLCNIRESLAIASAAASRYQHAQKQINPFAQELSMAKSEITLLRNTNLNLVATIEGLRDAKDAEIRQLTATVKSSRLELLALQSSTSADIDSWVHVQEDSDKETACVEPAKVILELDTKNTKETETLPPKTNQNAHKLDIIWNPFDVCTAAKTNDNIQKDAVVCNTFTSTTKCGGNGALLTSHNDATKITGYTEFL